jgi:cyanophycinase
MSSLFLHGGGDDQAWRAATFGRFLDSLDAGHGGPLALVVVEPSPEQAEESYAAYAAIFASLAPPVGLAPLPAGPDRPLAATALEDLRPCGIFVCGGATPLYHAVLCADPAWNEYRVRAGIPYGGTSAGAAIAAAPAILGGWRASRADEIRPILFQGAGEGLDMLTVRPGLGLTPFTIDVHASQFGTLSRLAHAVDLGLAAEGWAIDEDTVLEVNATTLRVYGKGQAYHLQAGDQGSRLAIYAGGAVIARP